MPADAQVVLVGGGNTILQGYLLEGLGNAGFDARDAGQHGELNGDAACNIVNRTLLGMGAPLELSKPLREAMFTEHSRSRRKHTTTQLFWTFVAACRDALDRLEAQQIVTRPNLRCLGNGAEFVLTPYRPRLSPTCGNCPLVHDHPDLRGHQPDPAHGHGPPAAEVGESWCLSRSVGNSGLLSARAGDDDLAVFDGAAGQVAEHILDCPARQPPGRPFGISGDVRAEDRVRRAQQR